MGLQFPRRAAGSTRPGLARRVALAAVLGVTVVLLAGCSQESEGAFKRLGMPEPITEQGRYTLDLWQGAWIAALITGAIVWGLIFYTAARFRRRSDDEIPIQTRYNLPLEIFYTIAPIIMVIVFFKATVDVQNVILDESENPDNTIEVVGQQWSWTFNYPLEKGTDEGPYVATVGTASEIPTLVLPVNETTRFNLHSPDVIHSFGVPAFLTKLDVIPGRVNNFEVKPTEIGEYAGKCFELCGTYHSRMLFNLRVVTAEEYDAYVRDLEAQGPVYDEALLGGENADTATGLEDENAPEGEGK